jgi:hypothetical protein
MNIFRDEALKMKMSESKLAATLDLPEESIIPPRDLIACYRDRQHLTEIERVALLNMFYAKHKDFLKGTDACLTMIVS